MKTSSRVMLQHPIFVQPDYSEERSGAHLLIWRDIPFWAVVDDELLAVLRKLDGVRSLEQIMSAHSEISAAKSDVIENIWELAKAGVISGVDVKPKLTKETAPVIENIALNLTRQCNLRCSFCYNLDHLSTVNEPELSAGEIIRFLGSIRKLLSRKPSLVILGGEPLVHSDALLEVAAWAAKHSFNVVVSTNGTLITQDFARTAKRIGLQVQVSIDSHIPELHDAIRGKGAFNAAINGVRTLVNAGTYTILSLVCHQGNLAYLEDYYDMAINLGVNEARFIPLKLIGGASQADVKLAALVDMLNVCASMLKRRPELLKLMGRDAFTITGNICRLSYKKLSCGTGCQTFLLDSDGSIYPCLNTNLPEFKVANIRDSSFDFHSAWLNSITLRNIRALTSVNQESCECSRCLVKHWCLGGCRGETYAVTGKITSRSPHCADMRSALINMFWLLSERLDLIKKSDTIC